MMRVVTFDISTATFIPSRIVWWNRNIERKNYTYLLSVLVYRCRDTHMTLCSFVSGRYNLGEIWSARVICLDFAGFQSIFCLFSHILQKGMSLGNDDPFRIICHNHFAYYTNTFSSVTFGHPARSSSNACSRLVSRYIFRASLLQCVTAEKQIFNDTEVVKSIQKERNFMP